MVLIIILTFNVYSGRKKLEQMEQSISFVRTQTYNMESELRNGIFQLENSLKEANTDVVDYRFSYDNLNAVKDTITLHFAFDLREVMGNAKYFVSYSLLEEDNYTEVEANPIGATSFDCNLDLFIKNNYKFNVIERTKDGGARQLKHDDIVNFLHDDFYIRRVYIQNAGGSEDSKRLLLDFHLANKTFGQEDYEIEKVELILSFKDNTTDTVVYREDITDNKDPDAVYSKVPAGSGSSSTSFGMSETTAIEKSSLDKSVDEKIKEEFFYVAISKEQLEEGIPGTIKGNLLNILQHKLIVTLKNGDVLEVY